MRSDCVCRLAAELSWNSECVCTSEQPFHTKYPTTASQECVCDGPRCDVMCLFLSMLLSAQCGTQRNEAQTHPCPSADRTKDVQA